MWHALAPVTQAYGPILCERHEPSTVLILNAGPGVVRAKGWSQLQDISQPPQINVEMRPGDQRIISGSLIRIYLHTGDFAAVGWRVLDIRSLL